MLSIATRPLALLPIVLLAACAQSPHRAYDVAGRSAVRATDVVASVPQTELNAQIIVSNAGGAAGAQFGLIGALVGAAVDAGVNSSRANTAEGEVRPLRDKLLGFDFDAQLKGDLDRELAALAWLKAGNVAMGKAPLDLSARQKAVRETRADGVLVLQSAYELTPDFATLRTTTSVSLLSPPAPAPAKKETRDERNKRMDSDGTQDKAKYYNVIVVEAPLGARGGAIADNRALWAEGDVLKRTLQAQAAETARLVALDLQYEAPAGKEAAPVAPVSTAFASPTRAKDGTLTSTITISALPQAQVAAVEAVAPAPAEAPATTTATTEAPAAAAMPAAAPAEAAPPAAAPAPTP